MLPKKFFSCASVLCLLALTLAIGCSDGNPLIPEIREIAIVSPINGSTWGSPEGVWQIVFHPIEFGVTNDNDLDFIVKIDNKEIKTVKPPYGNNLKLLSVVVPQLEVGEHHLELLAILTNKQVARGFTMFMIESSRESSISIEIINQPLGSSLVIGDVATINWVTVKDEFDSYPDYFKLYYSEDSSVSWISIDDNVPYSSDDQNYGWEVPVINGAGESDFNVKVEAYYTVGGYIAEDESDGDFTIDYGSVAQFIVYAPDTIIYNTDFNLEVTALDQYDNIIVNFNTTAWLTVNGMDFPLDNPPVIGDGGANGTWVDGVVTNYGYGTSFTSLGLPEGYHAIGVAIMAGPILGESLVEYVY